jgi:hypothetical protein
VGEKRGRGGGCRRKGEGGVGESDGRFLSLLFAGGFGADLGVRGGEAYIRGRGGGEEDQIVPYIDSSPDPASQPPP